MKGPWGSPDDESTVRSFEEYRRYRQLNRRHREHDRHHYRTLKRQRLMRQFGWPALAAACACAIAWAVFTFNPWHLQFVCGRFAIEARRSVPQLRCCARSRRGSSAQGPAGLCVLSRRRWGRHRVRSIATRLGPVMGSSLTVGAAHSVPSAKSAEGGRSRR
jgi:hypothetical protein